MKQPLPPTSDPTEHLFSSLREHPSIGSLAQTLSSIQTGEVVRYKGVTGSALAVIVAGLHIQETKQPLLIVANDEESAGYLYSDLIQILGRESVLFFPSSYRRHIRYGHTDAGSEVLRSELIARLSLGWRRGSPMPTKWRRMSAPYVWDRRWTGSSSELGSQTKDLP